MSDEPKVLYKADLDFESELFEAAVQMRGAVAPADYKHYVLPLLFLRYLSLRYEQRRDELRHLVREPGSAYYIEEEDLAAEVADELVVDPDEYRKVNAYMLPREATWDYIRANAQADDIKLKLDRAMELLEEKYPGLRGVLPKIYAGSNLDNDSVASLINLFSKDVFADGDRAVDLLGRTYEYFIANFAGTEGKRGGEFYTPSSIVRLMVRMLEPTRGTVLDPACGSGGMFIQSAEFTDRRDALSFYGQERIDTTLRLCRMNLILHGLDGDIRLGNSLTADQHPELKADYVITNPPFNMDSWGADKIDDKDARLRIGDRRGQLTDSNANYMWLMHFLYHLAEGGTAATVMANGSMTTNIGEEKHTRVALVEERFVDCIVQLPPKLFFQTGIPVCLWFLSRSRDGTRGFRARRDEILFVDARDLGQSVTRRQIALSDDEIERIAAVYRAHRTGDAPPDDEPGFCKVATLDEVRDHDYKLTPGLYVGTEADDEDDVPFEERMPELIDELRELFAESDRLQERILADLEGLG